MLAGTMALSLCACGGKAPEKSVAPEMPKTTAQEEIVKKSPAEMSKYIYEQDTAILDDDIRAQINLHNANWHNLCGETVALGIYSTMDEGASITDMAQKTGDELGLTAKDAVLVVITDTGDNYLGVGEESMLNEADITLTLTQGYDDLKAGILAKYLELNEYYMFNTKPAEPTTPTEKESEGPTKESTDQSIANDIIANFEQTMTDAGYIVIDVSDFNQEVYPDAKVVQAGNGHITFYILQGSADDTDNFWFFYYNKLLEFAPSGKFTQKYVPSDLTQPKSVYGTAVEVGEDGAETSIYYRADCIENMCIAASAAEDSYASSIDDLFESLGVPKNDNIVY